MLARFYNSLFALLGVVALVGGCSSLDPPAEITSPSPLRPARATDDAVTIDLYWMRATPEQEERLWPEVQEDRLPAELRRKLAEHGMRAGVIGAAPPDALLAMLNPTGDATAEGDTTASLADTGVRRRTRQVRPGEQLPLQATPLMPTASVLVPADEGPIRKSFADAEGRYTLSVGIRQDGRTRVSLRPEIRYGAEQLRFTPDETGVISHGTMTREAELFDELTLAAPLAAGEMLLVTRLPGAGDRLGALLHTPIDAGGDPLVGVHKAILVRVAQAPVRASFLAE